MVDEGNSVIEKEGENAVVEKVGNGLEDLQNKFLNKQIEDGKELSDITKDFAKAKVTSEIINDQTGKYDKFHKELAQEQKDTLKESFTQDKVKAQRETMTEKQRKAEAFYVSFRPILEFDFSNLIHNKYGKSDDVKPKEQKTYAERSYGIPLMCLMLALFVVPYCAFSIVLALFNGINAIFEGISTFGKVAKTIVTSLFVIFIVIAIAYCAILGIDALFGTDILGNIKF